LTPPATDDFHRCLADWLARYNVNYHTASDRAFAVKP
jgi:hypothetical protein